MILVINNLRYSYEMESLVKLFFPGNNVQVVEKEDTQKHNNMIKITVREKVLSILVVVNGLQSNLEKEIAITDEKEIERLLGVGVYSALHKLTGTTLQWGILTGIRPVRLIYDFRRKGHNDSEIFTMLTERYLVSREKAELLLATADCEHAIIESSEQNSFSLYVSIPFCPTRCRYCSFVSSTVERTLKLIPKYLDKLCDELKTLGQIAKERNLKLETIYIGGGTPTVLTPDQLTLLTTAIEENFDVKNVREYTIEAGRPDTITREKLLAIQNAGVSRISINPQTLNDQVLENIGRSHSTKQTLDAYKLAKACGFENINMDIIAGLPGDSLESFQATVDGIIALSPTNITVHTLCVKRSADLMTNIEEVHKSAGNVASAMTSYASKQLAKNGYHSYYLYRQKNCLEGLENVGYAKDGYDGLYNVFIMDETHSIFAAGASAATHLKNHQTGKINRIFNFKFPYEYVDRYDEIEARKDKFKIYEF